MVLEPWNKGKSVGQKKPFTPRQIEMLKEFLGNARKVKELGLFSLIKRNKNMIKFEHFHKQTNIYNSPEEAKAELFDILVSELQQPTFEEDILFDGSNIPDLVIDSIVLRSAEVIDVTPCGTEKKKFQGRIRYHLKPRDSK